MTQTYDAAGERTVLWDSTGRTTSTFDNIGKVTSVKNPANETITYSYFDDGLRKETTEPGGGLFTYTYDDASQMTLIKNPQGDLTTFEYDDAGRRTVIRRLGSRTSLVYDAASQVTTMNHRTTGGTNGLKARKEPIDNHRRSLAETAMHRFERCFGEG